MTLVRRPARRSTGNITISTPNGDLSGPCEIDVKAPNKNRAYMELDLTPLGVPQDPVDKFTHSTSGAG